VVVVEGINNYSGSLVASRIYDQGVYPPLPKRMQDTIGGFTLLAAAGPFSTSDSLDMAPLDDLIARVRGEEPDVLLLMGPYVDVNNSIVKAGCLPDNLTLPEFFSERVLQPLMDCISGLRTQLLLMPSQRDAHHPFEVYPQPPFQDSCIKHLSRDKDRVLFLPDPCTLSINGVCIGATSTDILFHLSARTMFRGSSGDRMAALAGHILRQQCYYPLIPPYRRDQTHTQAVSTISEGASDVPRPPIEACEVNLDYIQAFEEQHATLPVRPDLLLLPSDLKPFVKVLEGCVCTNPGHLTRKITGGTFVKLAIPELPAKPDLSTDIFVSVVHI
jgi:DNA polymerase alpha subunit B